MFKSKALNGWLEVLKFPEKLHWRVIEWDIAILLGMGENLFSWISLPPRKTGKVLEDKLGEQGLSLESMEFHMASPLLPLSPLCGTWSSWSWFSLLYFKPLIMHKQEGISIPFWLYPAFQTILIFSVPYSPIWQGQETLIPETFCGTKHK